MKKIIIAIDGPSASGKSTVAKLVAAKLNYKYIDTGAMYRCVALYALENNLDLEQLVSKLNEIHITFDTKNNVFLNGKDVTQVIRSREVTQKTPQIAADARIRKYLVSLQQKMGLDKGIVMDGRDITSVVFPEAELKIFQVASAQARAMRRYKENKEKGIESDLETLTKEVEQRDYQDSHRDASPMIKVEDAYEIDTSDMSIDQVVNKIIELAKEKGEKNE